MESLDINGIPTFYEQHEGRGELEIVFRTGIADEPIPLRGITHIVEHLAMFGWSERLHAANAAVSLHRCMFTATGEVDELVAFASGLNAALADLPLDRLDDEKRVLKIESGEHFPSYAERLLSLRYGLRGPGAAFAPQIGIDHLEGDRIDAWRAERFTSANAAIAISAPQLPAIELELPTGERFPMEPAVPLSGRDFPAAVAEGSGGVGFGFVIDRTPAAHLAMEALEELLLEALRTRHGLTYEILTSVERVAPTQLHFAIGAECRDNDSDLVVATALDVIRGLAETAPDEELVDRVRRRWLRHFEESNDRHLAELHAAVSGELFGSEISVADWLATYESATPSDLTTAWSAAIDSMLAIVPETSQKPDGLDPLWRPVPEIAAPRFKAKLRSEFMHVDIGPYGVAIEDVDDVTAGIRAHELVMSMKLPDGKYELLGVDETMITIDPSELKDKDGAIAALDDLAADSLVEVSSVVRDRVEKLAGEKLKRQWPVSDELKQLAEHLDESEPPVNLVIAGTGLKAGLLVLTERRLIWIYFGVKTEEIESFPLSQISDAKQSGMWNDKLKFEFKGERQSFKDMTPRARVAEFVEALSA